MRHFTITQFHPDNQDIENSNFILHKLGITTKGNPTFEDWKSCMQFILHASNHIHWWIGDMIRYGEEHYGQRYQEWIEKKGFDPQTLRNDKWVASRIELPHRRATLSYEHHIEVAGLEPPEQEKLLSQAEENSVTRELLRAEKQQLVLESRQHGTPPPDNALWLDQVRNAA